MCWQSSPGALWLGTEIAVSPVFRVHAPHRDDVGQSREVCSDRTPNLCSIHRGQRAQTRERVKDVQNPLIDGETQFAAGVCAQQMDDSGWARGCELHKRLGSEGRRGSGQRLCETAERGACKELARNTEPANKVRQAQRWAASPAKSSRVRGRAVD